SALGFGFAAPSVHRGEKIGPGKDTPPTTESPGVRVFDVQVPPGAQILAGSTSNADGGKPSTDLDLFLFYDKDGNGFQPEDQVAESAGAGADEFVALPSPRPGAYRFSVVGFLTSDPVSTFDFRTW